METHNKIITAVLSLLFLAILTVQSIFAYNGFVTNPHVEGGWNAVRNAVGVTLIWLVGCSMLLTGLILLLLNWNKVIFRNYQVRVSPAGIDEVLGLYRFGGTKVLYSVDIHKVQYIDYGFNMWSSASYLELWDKDPKKTVGFLEVNHDETATRFIKIMKNDLDNKKFGNAIRNWLSPHVESGLPSGIILKTWERRDIPLVIEDGVEFRGDGYIALNPREFKP